MPKRFKMPPRRPGDGAVRVERGAAGLILAATQDGTETVLNVSDFNACRLFGMLSLMLEIKLPDNLAEAIKLG